MAAQLGHPRGIRGRLLDRLLNRGNAELIAAAADEVATAAEVADLGFGGGRGLDLLLARLGPGGRVHGVEISSAMLSGARRRYRRHGKGGRLVLHQAGLEDLPLPDDAFDSAMTLNTLYFVGHLDRAFDELSRVLRPGGHLVLGLGDPVAMARMPFTAHGFRLRPVQDVVATAMQAGFFPQEQRRVGDGDDLSHLLVLIHA